MIRRIIYLKEAGDTIVEVLIALAIAGFLVGVAFVITSRSTVNEEQAQERSEAVGLLQTQIEALYMAQRGGGAYAITNTDFCMSPGASGNYSFNTNFSSNPPTSASSESNFNEYPSACDFSAGGAPNATLQPVFHIFITYSVPSGSAVGVYTLNCRWAAASGNGIDNMIMYYQAQ